MLFLTLFFTELQHYFVVLQVFSRVTFMVDIKIMLLNTTKNLTVALLMLSTVFLTFLNIESGWQNDRSCRQIDRKTRKNDGQLTDSFGSKLAAKRAPKTHTPQIQVLKMTNICFNAHESRRANDRHTHFPVRKSRSCIRTNMQHTAHDR